MSRPRRVEIDLSGWEAFREDGAIGRRRVAADERVGRALAAPAWPAARIWCPDHSRGDARLVAELMMTVEGPLLLAYRTGDDVSADRWTSLVRPFDRRKVRSRVLAAPVMLDRAGAPKLACPAHGPLTVAVDALRDASDGAVCGAVRHLRAGQPAT